MNLNKGKRRRQISNEPIWLKAIPYYKHSHGSGTLEKRLWTLTSSFVRIRDFHTFGGICVATGEQLRSWKEGQAGHYRSWPSCNGMFKFSRMNIHLQTAQSNSWPNSSTWEKYRETLLHRYGPKIIETIDAANKETQNRRSKEDVLEEIEVVLSAMKRLPETPDYFERVMKLKALSTEV